MAQGTARKEFDHEIFVSCHRKDESMISKLCNKLKKNIQVKIWFQGEVFKNTNLTDRQQQIMLRDAVSHSKIFLLLLSKKYTESAENVKFELLMAKEYNIPGIIVQLEMMAKENFKGFDFTNDWPVIRMYESPKDMEKWSGPNYFILVEEIEKLLGRELNKPDEHTSELDQVLNQAQNLLESSYRSKAPKVGNMKEDINQSINIELKNDGTVKIGYLKSGKYVAVENHIGDIGAINKKYGSKPPTEVSKWLNMLHFCFKYLGKSGSDCLNSYFGSFKVVKEDPLTIQFTKSQEEKTINEVISAYFVLLSKYFAIKTGIKTKNVIITIPADYGVLEKTNLQECIKKADLNLLKMISHPVSQVLTINEMEKKQKTYDNTRGTYAFIDLKSDSYTITIYERRPDGPVKILASFVDYYVDPVRKNKITLVENNDKLFDYQVKRSCELFQYMMEDNDLNITQFKRIDYSCFQEYSKRVVSNYEIFYKNKQFDATLFSYQQTVECLFGITIISKIIIEKQDVIDLSLDYNFGYEVYTNRFVKVIERKTPFPVTGCSSCYTIFDNQRSLVVRIYRGERPFVRYGEYLGEVTLNDLPKGKAGQVAIDIQFVIDNNGVLEVTAKESSHGTPVKTSIKSKHKPENSESYANMLIQAKENKEADMKLEKKVNEMSNLVNTLRDKYADDNNKKAKITNIISRIISQATILNIDICNSIINELKGI